MHPEQLIQLSSCKFHALTVLQVLHNAKEQWTQGKGAQTTSAATGSQGAEKKSAVEQVREGVASVTQNAQGGSTFAQHVHKIAEGRCLRLKLQCR